MEHQKNDQRTETSDNSVSVEQAQLAQAVDRRKFLKTIGMAGTAAAAAGLLQAGMAGPVFGAPSANGLANGKGHANGSVSGQVYGEDPCCCECDPQAQLKTIPTAAVLKTTVGEYDRQIVYLQGYYDYVDIVDMAVRRGSGFFVWYENATDTPDDGTIFAVTGVSTGRWYRWRDGDYVHVDWFGTIPNIDNDPAAWAANDSAFYRARANSYVCRTIHFGNGQYYIDQPAWWGNNQRLIGTASGEYTKLNALRGTRIVKMTTSTRSDLAGVPYSHSGGSGTDHYNGINACFLMYPERTTTNSRCTSPHIEGIVFEDMSPNGGAGTGQGYQAIGLYMPFWSEGTIRNVYGRNLLALARFRDLFQCKIERFQPVFCVWPIMWHPTRTHNRGTSVHFDNCFAKHCNRGWVFQDLKYSTGTTMACDYVNQDMSANGGPAPGTTEDNYYAYVVRNGDITLNGCGNERCFRPILARHGAKVTVNGGEYTGDSSGQSFFQLREEQTSMVLNNVNVIKVAYGGTTVEYSVDNRDGSSVVSIGSYGQEPGGLIKLKGLNLGASFVAIGPTELT